MTTYVDNLLTLYLRQPGVPSRPSQLDYNLATELENRQIPLSLVRTALLLTIARRTLRPSTAIPLSPIRSLAYFVPVIEELLLDPPTPSYIDYLHRRLARHQPTVST